MAQGPRHMSSEDFRAAGREMIDWIADYWEQLQREGGPPVLAQVPPGEVLAKLPARAPQHGEAWDAIVGDVQRVVMPALTHWQHPSFFAYFPANASAPAVLGELLSAGLGVNGMLWATSPAATEIETRMLDWVAAMLDLPAGFLSTAPNGGGVIQGTASESTLVAMLAARERARRSVQESSAPNSPAHLPTSSPPHASTPPTSPPPHLLTLYASTQAHSSVIKAAMIAGLTDGPDDTRCVRLIDVDEQFAMRPDLLERAISDDLAAGRTPFFVCATVGTTSSTAVDPLEAIGAIARRHHLWLHVDAAHAGAACICPEHRWMLRGVEHADSICFNPHKWLLTNFDCDLLWTSDRASLTRALSITPEYLRTTAAESGAPAAIDYRDWQIPLGRRFRALKLWFVLRHYGADGLRAYVREHVRLAGEFARWVGDDARFDVVAPHPVNLVCFRLRGPDADARNRTLLDRINATGRAYLTHTVLPRVGYVLRLAVGGTFTREEHVRAAWELIRGEAASV